MQVGATNYFYTRDHLGSIRELSDSTGAVVTRYDYDPYGRRTRLTGTIDADFGFTSHYHHIPSGLALAQYRAYSADFGRWISRDPIAENGGINLYAYVLNTPTVLVDPLGLVNWGQVGTGALSVLGGVAAAAGTGAAVGSGAGSVVAPLLALEAAAALSYGIGNIIAGLADNPCNHDATTKMRKSPGNLGGAVGRAIGAGFGDADGGQQAQDVGSLADNLIFYAGGFFGGSGESGLDSAIWLGGQVSSGAGAAEDYANLASGSH
jgi:RHS repeat-associated protein